MIRWLVRIFLGFLFLAIFFAGVVFSLFPDLAYRSGASWVQSYRGGIDGELEVAEPGYWLPVTRGVERRTVTVRRGGSYPLELFAMRVTPSKVDIRVLVSEPDEIGNNSIGVLAEKMDAIAMINGSFFNPDLGILGLCVSQGKVVSPLARYGCNDGVFFTRGKKAGLVHRDHYHGSGVENAVQTGPWLVRNRKIQEGFRGKDRVTRRSCVGMDKKGRVVLVVTDSIFSGITLTHLARLLAAPSEEGGFACVDALNLDGGTSTQAVLRTPDENHLVRGFLNVPVLIGVFPE